MVGLYALVSGICLISVFILYIRMVKGVEDSERKKVYLTLMLVSMFYLGTDVMWGVIYDKLLPISPFVQMIIYAFFYSGSAVLSYCWFYYVEFTQDSFFNRNAVVKRLVQIPMYFVIVSSFVSIWNGCMFFVDADGQYNRGELYVAQLLCTYGYIVFSAGKVVVKMVATRDFVKQNTYLIMLSYFVFPVVFGILQIVYASSPFLCIGIALASLQTYLFNVNFEEERERSMTKIHSLTRLFISSYYLDLQTGRSELLSEGDGHEEEYMTGDFYKTAPMEHEEAIRIYAENYVHREDKTKYCMMSGRNYMKSHLSSDRLFYSFNYRQVADGVEVWYRTHVIAASFNSEDEVTHVVMSVMNVDKEVRNELAHKEALEEALVQAEEANKAKSIFLSNISHDIRTPMNAILGFATLAKRHADNQELVRSHLEKINSAGAHLLSLINDVLDMGRIESGKLKIEENDVALTDIVHEVEDMIGPMAENSGLRFRIQTEIQNNYVYCDHLRLNQVLINLLGNAVKFTPQGGEITLSVKQEMKAPAGFGVYIFSVRDTGMGIAPEFMSRVFQAFEREQTSTISGIQGTGLGLAITQKIVEMMSGRISVSSEVGKGTEFTVKLVLMLQDIDEDALSLRELEEKHQCEEEKQERERRQLFAGRKVLLVEDNELNRQIARALLTEEGLVVEEAENGQIAVEKVKEAVPGTYELVLMDIQMPVMNGYEATKAIRRLPDKRIADIPVLAMTANAFSEERDEAIEAGMNGHIAKPIEIAVLFDTITQIIKSNN